MKSLTGILLLALCSFTGSFAQHTLSDQDVVVVDGIIQSSSYSGSDPHIIIPDTLDGQAVLGIADGQISYDGVSREEGVFALSGIRSVVFPSTIKSIGMNAFKYCAMDTIDLSRATNLERIGQAAFSIYTYEKGLRHLDFSHCTGLVQIEAYAFEGNDIYTLQFDSLPSLTMIDHAAFSGAMLTMVDISLCNALTYIGTGAFGGAPLDSIILPVNQNYSSLGWLDQNGSYYPGGTKVRCGPMFQVPATYVLKDDDVVLDDPASGGWGDLGYTSYNFALKRLVIPDTLDGLPVKQIYGGYYSPGSGYWYPGFITGKGLVEVSLPNGLEILSKYAFADNELLNIDLSSCSELVEIGQGAFERNPLDFIVLPVHEKYDFVGWRDQSGNEYNGGDTIHENLHMYRTFPASRLYIPDVDELSWWNVEVEQGRITSYVFSGIGSNVYIGDSIDGQHVIAIDDGSDSTSVFDEMGIQRIRLPTTLIRIEDYAFRNNEIDILDLSICQHIEYIGAGAFEGNLLDSMQLPESIKPGYRLKYWEDETGASYRPGAWVSDFARSYEAVFELSTYPVIFTLTDGIAEMPGVQVTLEGYGSLFSNALGQVYFTEVRPADSLFFSVEAPGFVDVSGYITVGDSSVHRMLSLEREHFSVRFTISDAAGPLSEAFVEFGEYGIFYSDMYGVVSFPEVYYTDSIPFYASAPAHRDTSGIISVHADRNITVILESALAYPENKAGQFLIYPNPAGESIFLELDREAELRIVSCNGQEVFRQEFGPGLHTIDLSTSESGVYILEFLFGERLQYAKLLLR